MDSDFEKIRKLPEIKDPLAVFNILELELKRRVTLMNKFQKRGDTHKNTHKAMAIVSMPHADEATLCGALFSEHFPTHKIKNCVWHLRVNPFNSKFRREMLELLMKIDIKSVLIYREVLFHALLEISFSHISGGALNIARKAQIVYLKILTESLEEVLHPQDGAKLSKNEPITARAQVEKKEELHKQQQGIEFLKECQSLFEAKRIDEAIELDMDQLLNNKNINMPQFGKAFVSGVSSMMFLPATRVTMEKWFLLSKIIFAKIPLPQLYEAKMNRVRGKIFLAASKTDDKRFLNDFIKTYTTALKNINAVVPKIGNVVKSPIDKNCIFEYARVIIEIMKYFPSVGFKINEEYHSHVNRCIELLSALSQEKSALELQAMLFKELKYEERNGQKTNI